MQAPADLDRTNAPGRFWTSRRQWGQQLGASSSVLAALFFVTSYVAYLADLAAHRTGFITWYDLHVYNDAGLITRFKPSILYSWQLVPGVKFTYTPFAAIIFSGGSLLSFSFLRWLMTLGSLAAIPLVVWRTLGGMGKQGRRRLTVALAVSAVALWIEPVAKSLQLGQVEPLLLLLVVWDLTRPDASRWKGIGIGLAAGIKIVPGLFIPYLLLTGKIRQAVVAAATFAATVLLGFILLPGPSSSYWLTGYFLRPGRTGGVDSLVDQSLLAIIARLAGGEGAAHPIWLPIAIVVALIGVIGGAMLTRAGKPVQGWVLVGITSLLASPISWDHHWVWMVPLLAMLAGVAMDASSRVRFACVALVICIVGVFAAYPYHFFNSAIPGRGLLGSFTKPPEVYQVTTLHGWNLLTFNLFVLSGSAIYLLMLVWAVIAWRKRPRKSKPATSPGRPSALDSLLAHADAVLKGGNGATSGKAVPSTDSAHGATTS